MRARDDNYVGIEADRFGGMTVIGRLIRDARVFSIIPEEENCAGWSRDRLQAMFDTVNEHWDRCGGLVSQLPPDLRERHARIHADAVRIAREAGWSGELELEDDR